MNQIYNTTVVIFFILLISACEKLPPEIQERVAYAEKRANQSYSIDGSYNTKKEAVYAVMTAAATGDLNQVLSEVADREQYLDIYWVNQTSKKLREPGYTFENLWNTRSMKNKMGAIRLTRKFKGKNINEISDIKVRETWELNTVKAHIIDTVLVIADGKNYELEEIQIMLEHEGQFKVLGIGID